MSLPASPIDPIAQLACWISAHPQRVAAVAEARSEARPFRRSGRAVEDLFAVPLDVFSRW